MREVAWISLAALLAGLLGTTAATAQQTSPQSTVALDASASRALAARVDATGDGTVYLSFAARPGVCGNGGNVRVSSDRSEWGNDCEPGSVRVSLTRRDGQVTALRSYVGGRWRTAQEGRVTDLGTVPAAAAAAYLVELAGVLPATTATAAIFPSTLADSVVVWPELIRLARDGTRPSEVRQQAVFWVSQAAGAAATRELSALADENDVDLGVRERAVFALSQRPSGEGVTALLRVAETSPSPRLRQRAIFWLGQSRDPRALAYFERVLAGTP